MYQLDIGTGPYSPFYGPINIRDETPKIIPSMSLVCSLFLIETGILGNTSGKLAQSYDRWHHQSVYFSDTTAGGKKSDINTLFKSCLAAEEEHAPTPFIFNADIWMDNS